LNEDTKRNLAFLSSPNEKEEENKFGLVTSVSWLTVLGVGSGHAF
jgi:hypothetical protein